MRKFIFVTCFLSALAVAPSAQAAIPSVFNGDVACTVQGDGERWCGSSAPRSTTKTFDGVPLDVNVAFPPTPTTGPDGNFPLIMLFHGYGGGKLSFANMQTWLDRGYATFSMTDRGFRESCGSPASKAADPAGCQNGFVRLIDNRYEVRDAQVLAAELADDDLINPTQIGAIGGSYGGGMSLALAALRNRVMMPDNSLVPWVSPEGKAMEIAAATPAITWSDLAYSLVPNGSTLDYTRENPYRGRYGVMKQSLVNGLYVSGLAAPGYYAAPGTAPDADITGWRNRLLQGEPYDGDPTSEAVLDEVTSRHSAYYIDHSRAPAPVLLANGWSDDLFPVDEMVRFYNRTRSEFPNAPISLFAAEIQGHPRSLSKPDALSVLEARQTAWMDHYVRGIGPEPFLGVEARAKTCPAAAPSGKPYRAPNWAKISKGEIRLRAKPQRTIAAGSGDPAVANPFDPVSGSGACATTSAVDEAGTLNYRTRPAPSGYTVLGSPTVVANFTLPGNTSQVAARLLDVDPQGQQSLVARGLWRPATGGPKRQVFQLHPAGWRFERGHVAKLQLLARDAGTGPLGGYGRPSNNQRAVKVSDLELRLPVGEKPGAKKSFVKAPKPKFLPQGRKLARDFRRFGRARAQLAAGKVKVVGGKLRLRVKCPKAWVACRHGKVQVKAAPEKAKGAKFAVAKGAFAAKGGRTKTLRLEQTRRARRYFAAKDSLAVRVAVRSAETEGAATAFRYARG